jgi:hypothetical protein
MYNRSSLFIQALWALLFVMNEIGTCLDNYVQYPRTSQEAHIDQLTNEHGEIHRVNVKSVSNNPLLITAIHLRIIPLPRFAEDGKPWPPRIIFPSAVDWDLGDKIHEYYLLWSTGKEWHTHPLPVSAIQLFPQKNTKILVVGLNAVLQVDRCTKRQQYVWIEPWTLIRQPVAMNTTGEYLAVCTFNALDKVYCIKVIRVENGHSWSAESASIHSLAFDNNIIMATSNKQLYRYRICQDGSSNKLIENEPPEQLDMYDELLGAINGIPVLTDKSHSYLKYGKNRIKLRSRINTIAIVNSCLMILHEDGSVIYYDINANTKQICNIELTNVIANGSDNKGIWVMYNNSYIWRIYANGDIDKCQYVPWKGEKGGDSKDI